MIGLNNLAKVDGIKEEVEDDKTTLRCDSLNNLENKLLKRKDIIILRRS